MSDSETKTKGPAVDLRDKRARRQIDLPSGARCDILERIGAIHVVRAARLVGAADQANMSAMTAAMVAVTCLIDGRAMTYEEVLDESDGLSSADLWALYGIGMGKDGGTSPKPT